MADLACDVSTTASVPVADSFYEDRIEFPGDCDWVKVQLQAGRRYHFYYDVDQEYDGSDTSRVVTFGLRGSDGAELTSIRQIFSTYLLGFAYAATQSGPHYVSISAGGSAVGYRLAAGPDCAEEKPTSCALKGPGQPRTGKVQSNYDTDTIRVSLEAGRTYTFELTSDQAEVPELFRLYGRRRTWVYGESVTPPEGAASAKRIGPFTAPATGPYLIAVGHGLMWDGPATYRVTYNVE